MTVVFADMGLSAMETLQILVVGSRQEVQVVFEVGTGDVGAEEVLCARKTQQRQDYLVCTAGDTAVADVPRWV
jgi:hypothetical protein